MPNGELKPWSGKGADLRLWHVLHRQSERRALGRRKARAEGTLWEEVDSRTGVLARAAVMYGKA